MKDAPVAFSNRRFVDDDLDELRFLDLLHFDFSKNGFC